MSCNTDVKRAAVEKIYKSMVDGRFTFSRKGPDVIVINGRQDNGLSRAESRVQAKQIAQAMKKSIAKEYQKKIQAFMIDEEGHPIVLKVIVADDYVEKILQNQEEKERDYVNTNSGPNSYTQMDMFSAPAVSLGVFEKYVQFKQGQLSTYKRRLNQNKADQRDRDKNTAELTALKIQERELTNIIEGNQHLGIKGLETEIAEIMGLADILAVAPYVQQDFVRLNLLANSKDTADLKEAENLVAFYELAGRFEKNMYDKGNRVYNPFFSEAEMFHVDQNGNLTNVYKVDEATRDEYAKWAAKAVGFKNIINDNQKTSMVDTVNSNSDVVKTYGPTKKFTYDELTWADKGLKDADWISAWTMDVTHGIGSHNGLLPQVGYSTLLKEYNKGLVKVKEYNEKIDELNPKVIKRLKELNHTLKSKGIVGIQGISYQIFKEITKDGNETNGLVQRFTKEYGDEYASAKHAFDLSFRHAANIADPTSRQAAINKAHEAFKKWRRQNQVILDVTKLPELAGDPEFATMGIVADPAYRQSIIDMIGQKGYDEQVANQIKLLRNFQSERQAMIDSTVVMRGKASYADLDNVDKVALQSWQAMHSPLRGIEDYNNVTGIVFGTARTNNYMNYNTFIARKYKPSIVADIANNKYNITDTADETGHYSKAFAEIEKDAILSEFYYLVKDGLQSIREAMPPEIQAKMPQHTILSMKKDASEIALDKNTPILMRMYGAFKELWDKLRQSFGVTAQSELSYATIDPVTGKPNYQINDEFFRGNIKELKQLMLIENTKFLQAFNSSIPNNSGKLDRIDRHTVRNLDDLNESALLAIAEYLHIDLSIAEIRAGQLDKLKNRVHKHTDSKGNVTHLVEIGKYIRDFSVHTMVQSQSFDLAKLMKYHHNLAQIYSAKQKALPVLSIIKKHYEQIQKPGTNNISVQTTHVPTGELTKEGVRERAIKQYEDWFQRVILGNTGIKHKGAFGTVGQETGIGRKIYSNAEKERMKEIRVLLANEPDVVQDSQGNLVPNSRKEELQKILDGMGKTRTATALVENFLEWIKVLRLGYSLSSMSTNFMEGMISNMMIGSTSEYFDPKELFYAYGAVKHSFLKNITFGKAETPKATKIRTFMDRHNVIVDSSNELQRSSHETTSDKLAWMNPHAGNQRTEFINQSPLMIAMLRTIKIKDINGNEKSVWDASDKHGRLLPDFAAVADNAKNWDDLTGQDYLNYKAKLEDVITKAHGNYSELRGMMAKSNSYGKAAMMFKTWVPQQLAWRFGVEQPDILSGRLTTKGTLRSLNKGTAGLYMGTIGLAILGPWGALGGAIAGAGALAISGRGSDTGIGVLRESIESARLLVKKMLGLPVNMLSGMIASKQLININKKQVFGKGDYFDWNMGPRFTKVDQNNLKNTMTDIALQLDFILLLLLTKAMFWDDDDDKDAVERQVHNVVANKLMQLSGQASSYANPAGIYKSTVGSMAVLQYLEDLGKEVDKITKAFQGKDIIAGGVNTGESGLWNQSQKILMPGIFKDGNPAISILKGEVPKLGFGSQTEKQFTPSYFDEWFKSAEKRDKETNKSDRAGKRAELRKNLKLDQYEGDTEDDRTKAREKEINRILNETLPTPQRLKKLGTTREEFLKAQENQ